MLLASDCSVVEGGYVVKSVCFDNDATASEILCALIQRHQTYTVISGPSNYTYYQHASSIQHTTAALV